MSTHKGSCHCGAIGYEYRCDTPPADWAIRACQCRFCRAHHALSASEPGAELAFHADHPAALTRYRFALGTADFLLCSRCGVYIGAVLQSDEGDFGIINTLALVDAPADLAEPQPISYDGEDTGGRVSRRTERWTRVTALPW